MEASFLYRVAFPTRSLTIYSYLISSRTGFSAFFFALGLSLVLQLHISLISSSMQFWSLCITIPQIASLHHFRHMVLWMKNDLSCLLVFSFLGTQLTFWPFVLPVVVVSTLPTYWLLMVLIAVDSQLFSAASSGLLHLSFPSVMDLSICTGYVNCPSDLFVALSNLAFRVWCIFFCFLKTFFERLSGEVRAASASLCLPGD